MRHRALNQGPISNALSRRGVAVLWHPHKYGERTMAGVLREIVASTRASIRFDHFASAFSAMTEERAEASIGPVYRARTNGSLRRWPEEFRIKLYTGKAFFSLDDALVRGSSGVTASSDTGTWMGGDEGLVGKRLALLKDVVRDYREWRRS